MTIQDLPVWPFEPNWTASVGETLEWLTDVLQSPTGSEQRRSMRYFPRKTLNFTIATEGEERSLLDNLLMTYSAQEWYLPIWYDVSITTAVSSGTSIPVVPSSGIAVGTIIFIMGSTVYDYQIAEVTAVGASTITLADAPGTIIPSGSRIFPMTIGRLVEQPAITAMSDGVETAIPQFLITEKPVDPGVTPRTAGPLIVDGLIVNAYHQETGRGGYFHHNSGTSEGQFIFIYALYLAYEQLVGGTSEQQEVAFWYKSLAETMLDAMGTGDSYVGPMLRQPIPPNIDTITLLHWLFAARGDIPGQQIILTYEVTPSGGNITIPASAGGENVFKVWQIYPGTSALLYDSPFSPAYDIASPAGETQILITEDDWSFVGGVAEIDIPAGAPTEATWKVVYGYTTDNIIPRGFAFEAYPNWTSIPAGYAACAPDTFRWFEQAMQKAILHDARPGNVDKWTSLKNAMQRSAVRGQAITDLREVIEPMPGFEAVPVNGAPDGMYCWTDAEGALGPTGGGNPDWKGHNFWSRNASGVIVGSLPKGVSQIGRGFTDQWREAETYQDADQYLYINIGAGRLFEATEHLRVYVSSTQAYDPATRWFADIATLVDFEATSDTIEFFIPRTSFRLATNFEPGEDTTWGTTLPAGTELQNFGIEVAVDSDVTVRLHSLRLVSDNTPEAVLGSKMPFFPGAMPFAINADLKRQRFVGWNGSPFHGYQLPDHWWWLGNDSAVMHADLTVADLPIPAADGSLTYPLSPTNAGSAVAKITRGLLMEQQLHFLKQAQEKYAADGGPNGFFAHTFVMNTPARASLGNPTPHTWVYVNDDPNTRWVGYQTRVVESLAELALLTDGDNRFTDARTLALTIVDAWLTRLNVIWPDLNGVTPPGGVGLVYGMPTDFPDPAISAPQTLYEEPHAAAHVLRACLTLKKDGGASTALYNSLITRCWTYLEMMWCTTGEMAYTWSPDPDARQWYGFWHGDIMTALALMLENTVLLPSGINPDTVALRLVQTKSWLEEWGVGFLKDNEAAGLLEQYRGAHVLTLEPNWAESTERSQARLLDTMDHPTGISEQVDTAGRPFPTQRHRWVLDGVADHSRFYALMQALRGRAVALWVPTWMDDMRVSENIAADDGTITVARCGFTLAGGPRPERQDIMIETTAGERFYRRITDSTIDGSTEVIGLDYPLGVAVTSAQVLRVCFISLMRMDQDSVEIDHLTDREGVSEVQITFRAAPDTRVPTAAFYEV